jgi:hypothetical protein
MSEDKHTLNLLYLENLYNSSAVLTSNQNEKTRLKKYMLNFLDFMQNSPLYGSEIDLSRDNT